jgi:hypothetical protein
MYPKDSFMVSAMPVPGHQIAGDDLLCRGIDDLGRLAEGIPSRPASTVILPLPRLALDLARPLPHRRDDIGEVDQPRDAWTCRFGSARCGRAPTASSGG